jgi:hypothetical protein
VKSRASAVFTAESGERDKRTKGQKDKIDDVSSHKLCASIFNLLPKGRKSYKKFRHFLLKNLRGSKKKPNFAVFK